MAVIRAVSEGMIPALVLAVILWGLYCRLPVYDVFVQGVKKGLKTVVQVCPVLIGLMISVRVLSASGFLEVLAKQLEKPMKLVGIPAPLVPSFCVRMFSSSAATGLVLELFERYGTDSYIGLLASILMSCTETVFYTMSVYYLSVKVTKTRWTLAGALIASAAGLAASVWLAGWLCPGGGR